LHLFSVLLIILPKKQAVYVASDDMQAAKELEQELMGVGKEAVVVLHAGLVLNSSSPVGHASDCLLVYPKP